MLYLLLGVIIAVFLVVVYLTIRLIVWLRKRKEEYDPSGVADLTEAQYQMPNDMVIPKVENWKLKKK